MFTGVGRVLDDRAHDCDEHVLLPVERSGVEGEVPAEEVEPLGGHDLLEQLTQGVSNELTDVRRDGNGRITNAEQLVDETDDAGEEQSDEPGTEGETGNGGVVEVVNNTTDDFVGRVLGSHDRLELHRVDEARVPLGVLGNVGVVQKLLDLVNELGGEVLVVLVHEEHLVHDLLALLQAHVTNLLLGLSDLLRSGVDTEADEGQQG